MYITWACFKWVDHTEDSATQAANDDTMEHQVLIIADVSHFQKLKEETSFDFDIHWNSEPSAIGKTS